MMNTFVRDVLACIVMSAACIAAICIVIAIAMHKIG